MSKFIKTFILASALLLGFSFSTVGVDTASADTSYNTTVKPGEKKKVAEESIWADAEIVGFQTKVYSSSTITATYYSYDASGRLISQETFYNETEVKVVVDANALGENISVWIKNLRSGINDIVKAWGTLID